MNTVDVLILNGSPGSGKSTLADAISEILRQSEFAHAVIDVDELGRIFPEEDSKFIWKNLGLIWPSFSKIPNLKVILPVLIDTEADLRALKIATPCRSFSICELTASESTLKDRVTAREPNTYWQSKLRDLVTGYIGRDDTQKFRDFTVDTGKQSVENSATEIISAVGWEKHGQ